jgi:hypothetical protein
VRQDTPLAISGCASWRANSASIAEFVLIGAEDQMANRAILNEHLPSFKAGVTGQWFQRDRGSGSDPPPDRPA